MTRAFGPEDLVQLPRLSAREALVLITALLISAKAAARKHGRLPDSVERSRRRLVVARDALHEALLPPPAGSDSQAARRADTAIDLAWSAAFDWLSGWRKVPLDFNAHHAAAEALAALLFPDALAFTRLPYKVEWSESQSRLDAIERDGHARTFAALGGSAFLQSLSAAQTAYGAALGLTRRAPEEPAAPDVAAPRLAAIEALRSYVLKVSAHADPEEPGSEALSETLLADLAAWESAAPARNGESEPTPPSDPTPTPA